MTWFLFIVGVLVGAAIGILGLYGLLSRSFSRDPWWWHR